MHRVLANESTSQCNSKRGQNSELEFDTGLPGYDDDEDTLESYEIKLGNRDIIFRVLFLEMPRKYWMSDIALPYGRCW